MSCTSRGILLCGLVALASPPVALAQSVFGIGGGYQIMGDVESEPVAALVFQFGFGQSIFLGYGVNAIIAKESIRADSLGPAFRELGHGPLADFYPVELPGGWSPHIQAGYQWNRTRLNVDESLRSWSSLVGGIGLRRGAADFVIRGTFPRVDDRPNFFTFELHLGCRCGVGGPERLVTMVEVTSVPTITAVGEIVRVTAALRDIDGQDVRDAAVTWFSRNPAVASVDDTGVIAATGNGTTQIVAAVGNVSGETTVTVAQRPVAISVHPLEATLTAIAETVALEATVHDRNGEPIPGVGVSWVGGDPSVASVDPTGLVTARGTGTVQITARLGDVSAPITVTVQQQPTAIEIPTDQPTLEAVGETIQLSANVRDPSGAVIVDALVEWSSASPEVVSVDANGLALARGSGIAQITATAGEVSGLVAVTVEQRPATIEVTPTDPVLPLGGELNLIATVRDRNGGIIEDAPVRWLTSAPEVATVSLSGLLAGHARGVANITAVSRGVSSSIIATVVELQQTWVEEDPVSNIDDVNRNHPKSRPVIPN
jgi:uncharacterized protein YjdB